MELAEPIEDINEKLVSHYGKYDDRPNFRVIWSNDQFEKRWMTHTNEGFELIHPEVREVPKYHHYVRDRWVLERLIPVDENQTDLTVRISYEPCWVFNHAETGEYIPPRFDMCSIIVESLLFASGNKNTFRKYQDPEVDPEYRARKLDKAYNDLFGNETPVADALRHKFGVVNPAGKELFQQKES